jgi:hypothetical protein
MAVRWFCLDFVFGDLGQAISGCPRRTKPALGRM